MTASDYLQGQLFEGSDYESPIVSHTPYHAEVMAKREEFGSARRFGDVGPNPLHDPRASTINWSGPPPADVKRGRFIPTSSIVSSQPQVSREAIAHLVANSSGLDTPDVEVRQGTGDLEDTYALRDGNHRVNAALERGQMLVPAEVNFNREEK